MKPLKHSKFKNTGILFELLVRQVASDIMNSKTSPSVGLIKKYFREGTELNKELVLYKGILEEKFKTESTAKDYIQTIIASRKTLNETNLRKEKFKLIRDINAKYVMESFFNAKIQNYAVLAAIYKLFEYRDLDNPADMVRSKSKLVEFICTPKQELVEVKDDFSKLDRDVRLLSYKLLVDKFNEKYNNLLPEQKELLRIYVNGVEDTVQLKEFVGKNAASLRRSIETNSKKLSDKATKIKVQGILDLLENIEHSKKVQEKHVFTMLKFYELANELSRL